MIIWRWQGDTAGWEAQPVKPGAPAPAGDDAVILSLRDGKHVLLARDGVRVNGAPSLPIRMLMDRDEIAAPGATYYFSTASPPESGPFRCGKRAIHCARCNDPMCDGDTAVFCGVCKAAHHEACWSYDTHCGSCRQPADAAGWQPEPLGGGVL
jgi:hypothetical protein